MLISASKKHVDVPLPGEMKGSYCGEENNGYAPKGGRARDHIKRSWSVCVSSRITEIKPPKGLIKSGFQGLWDMWILKFNHAQQPENWKKNPVFFSSIFIKKNSEDKVGFKNLIYLVKMLLFGFFHDFHKNYNNKKCFYVTLNITFFS